MYWVRILFRKKQAEAQLDSEVRFHLEQQIAEYIQSGMVPEQARRRAHVEFGGVEAIKENCRESRRVHVVETLLQDVRYGLRMMQRSPGFAAVVILTLALGIGANTAIFSVVNGVLLNPLPYPHPEQLVALHESKVNFAHGSISYPNFVDWQKENRTFASMAVARGYAFSLTGSGEAEQVNGEFVSSEYFQQLGVTPVLGRMLAPGEDEIGAAPIALISAGLWQRKFGAAPDVLGKSITLDGKNYAIVGVIPAGFRFPSPRYWAAEIYLPIGQWNNPLLSHRSSGLGIHGIGRLKPGVSIEQARADMERVANNLAAAYPDANKGTSASLVPLREHVVGDVKPFLLVLLGAVGFVLLIACVNVANLLLARSASRAREFAIRVAVGASGWRVVRQLLTESVLHAVAVGALGLGLAAWGMRTMLKMLPAETLPRLGEIKLDLRVLLFTLLVSLLSGIVFGLTPALKASAADVAARIKEGGRNASRGRHRVQNTFVVVEMALALVLLVGAGLMIRSLGRLWSVDLPPSMMKASPVAIRAAFRQLDDTLAAIPGVQSSSVSWGAVPMQNDDETLFWMEGQPKPSSPHDMNWALSYVVGPDYLKTMGITLQRGRFFEAHDDEHSPLVAVVDEVLAQKFFPDQDPVGKLIRLEDYDRPTQIVGVVKHVKQWGLDTDDKQSLRAQLYRPFMQLPDPATALAPSGTGVMVRGKGDVAGLFVSIRNVLRQASSEQVVFGGESMDETIAKTLAERRYSMILLGGFAILALILASVGIYGVVSYVVGQQTHEIGIRMALGARRVEVLRLVIGNGARLVLVGIVAGAAVAVALTRLMTSLLFDVSATDPLTFASVAILLLFVALMACAVPARRASRVDPIVALRYE